MAGKFNWQSFSSVNLSDDFFDSLKADYPEFVDWFSKKQREDKSALVYNDERGIGAFLYLKRENIGDDHSSLVVDNVEMPNIPRLKNRYFTVGRACKKTAARRRCFRRCSMVLAGYAIRRNICDSL